MRIMPLDSLIIAQRDIANDSKGKKKKKKKLWQIDQKCVLFPHLVFHRCAISYKNLWSKNKQPQQKLIIRMILSENVFGISCRSNDWLLAAAHENIWNLYAVRIQRRKKSCQLFKLDFCDCITYCSNFVNQDWRPICIRIDRFW